MAVVRFLEEGSEGIAMDWSPLESFITLRPCLFFAIPSEPSSRNSNNTQHIISTYLKTVHMAHNVVN